MKSSLRCPGCRIGLGVAGPVALLCVSLATCTKKADSAPQPAEEKSTAAQSAPNDSAAGANQGSGMTQPNELPPPDDVAAAPADATKTPSGLAFKVLKPGDGKTRPGPADTVEVHYTGWTTDGKMFDSSVTRGRPARFPLDRVIKGWTEGLQLMSQGEKTRFWIPAELAYGTKPARPGAPAGMLVFDVELIAIH